MVRRRTFARRCIFKRCGRKTPLILIIVSVFLFLSHFAISDVPRKARSKNGVLTVSPHSTSRITRNGRFFFYFFFFLLLDLEKRVCIFSPTHKRTEGRAPVWGSEFTSKDATLQGGIQQKKRCWAERIIVDFGL